MGRVSEKSNHLSALLAGTVAIRMRPQHTAARPDCRGGLCTLLPTPYDRSGASPSYYPPRHRAC